jgi:hypothetical protein
MRGVLVVGLIRGCDSAAASVSTELADAALQAGKWMEASVPLLTALRVSHSVHVQFMNVAHACACVCRSALP